MVIGCPMGSGRPRLFTVERFRILNDVGGKRRAPSLTPPGNRWTEGNPQSPGGRAPPGIQVDGRALAALSSSAQARRPRPRISSTSAWRR
jgi:hypothetical protein